MGNELTLPKLGSIKNEFDTVDCSVVCRYYRRRLSFNEIYDSDR